MANKQISDFTSKATLSDDDQFLIQESDSETKKVAFSNIVNSGVIYNHVGASSTDVDITGIGTDYVKLTGLGLTAFLLAGADCSDVANDQFLMAPSSDGDYDLSGTISFSGTSNTTLTFAVFVNGVQSTSGGEFVRGFGSGLASVGAAGIEGCLSSLVEGDTIDIRVKSNTANSSTINISSIHLKINRVRIA